MGPPPGQPPGTPPPAPTATMEAPTPVVHARDNWANTVRDACGNRGNTDRNARDTHSVTDPGTVDSDLHPALTECLGSSQSNRRCGEMTQTKFK